MAGESSKRPLPFTVAKWYGYIFSLTYIVYGGVSIILEIMDNKYENTTTYVISLLVGIILLTVVFAFRDLKGWGWFGMVGITGLTMLLALLHIKEADYVVMFILSAGALGLLLLPSTRDTVLKRS